MTNQAVASEVMAAGIPCEYCGALRPMRQIELNGHSWFVGYAPCGCSGAVHARTEQLLAEQQAQKREEDARIIRAYEAAGLPRRYHSAESERASSLWDTVADGGSLYIQGNVGTGKTHLACAILKAAIADNRRVKFVSTLGFLDSVKASYDAQAQERESDLVNTLVRCEVLALDDLGKEQPSEWALSKLFRIVDARYAEMRPTIVTTQFKRTELAKRFNSNPETAQALISRLKQDYKTVKLDGVDKRLGDV